MRKSNDYILRNTARLISYRGLHRGEQLVGPNGELDLAAAIYQVTNPSDIPAVFLTDEAAALDLIHSDPVVMDAIRHLSSTLLTEPPLTDGQPDYVEHVCHWVMTPAIGETQPPSVAEIIGRLLRAADQADQHTAANSIAA